MLDLFKDEQENPELFFGLVDAVGTNLDFVQNTLIDFLEEFNYRSFKIRIIDLLQEIDAFKIKDEVSDFDRYDKLMDNGNDFRKAIERGDALALLTIPQIRLIRAEENSKIGIDNRNPSPRAAYILRSLKTPREVETLREIYNKNFYVISVYSSRNKRVLNLAKKIAPADKKFNIDSNRAKAEHLIDRDKKESDSYGQNVSETFPLGDLFIDVDDHKSTEQSIKRFLEMIFSYPHHTPEPDEYGMFNAKAASLRSGSLARQVGASIVNNEGEVVSLGSNEVPKFGGGQYWPTDEKDHRDCKKEKDISDEMRRNLFVDILKRLKDAGWLSTKESINFLVDNIISGNHPELRKAHIMDIIEYGRSVHAEMAAMMDALRRGISVKDCTLFVTTFPCHECARHIIAAGIKKVVYIEPYPKSLVLYLHEDSVCIEESQYNKVHFSPYVGISPSKYFDFFSMLKRKQNDGSKINWHKNKVSSNPKFVESYHLYINHEAKAIAKLNTLLVKKGLISEEEQNHGTGRMADSTAKDSHTRIS